MATSRPLQCQLSTPLGDQALLFQSLSAVDRISQLYDYEVTALSDDPALDPDALLGKPAAVSVDMGGGQLRWFHGIVAAFGLDGGEGGRLRYRLVLRPWLWLLTRSADIRIFQDKTVPEILQSVFAEYQGSVQLNLSGSYAPRTYCVQYRETDFNFVCRLMEEEGIFFWFTHSASKHDLVVADEAGAHLPFTGYETIKFRTNDKVHGQGPSISDWHVRHEIQTGKVTLRDYNFEKPSTDLLTESASHGRGHASATLEVYDYPGGHAEKSRGNALARLRVDEAAGRFARIVGQADVAGVVVGHHFALAEHPRADQNTDYLVLATQTDVRQADYESSAGQGSSLHCRFTLQPLAEPFRPQRATPKPHVAGPQTAVVVGQGDAGDIKPDKYGRVQVQFHWDRLGQKDGKQTCWVRVASPLAGNGWGFISLPRLGQEVVVDFLEGDPDQPLITGRVHNAEQMPPYELPANASVSTFKSRSVKGDAALFNELRFEDKKGSEYVWLQAQKDRYEVVEETYKGEIGKDEHRTVKGLRKEKIEGEHHQEVVKSVKRKVGQKFSLESGQDMLLKTGAGYSLKAAMDIAQESGKTFSVKAGTDGHMKLGMNLGVDAGMNVHIKGGMNMVLEAGMQITLKAGPATIVLGPSGVSITGPMVLINSGGAAGAGSGASPVAPTAPEAPEAPEAPKDPLSHR